ncbi:hypothetical protein NQ315_009081, partial [Exocentrus adspersus]
IGIQPNSNNTWINLRNTDNVNPNPKFTTTTPWPVLGQRRNQQQSANSNQLRTAQPNNNPMWIRPNNGPNWVKNTPVPVRISAGTNTNFLNNERGGVQSGSNQRQNSNHNNNQNQMATTSKPISAVSQVQNMNTQQPVQNGGGLNLNSNNNYNRKGLVSSGSKNTNSDTTNQKPNEPSNVQDKNEEGVEDYELREFSEELLTKETNNAARFVTVNVQGMTTSRSTNDEAPLPLLSIDNKAYSIPSIEKLMLLYNNYILEANQNEVYTAQEKIEENNLLDTILSTPVMQHTRNFLIRKGKIGKDPKEFKDLLRAIWFGMYSRGKGRIGSSGFEHVFLAELKEGQVSGLHNWLYFNEEEKSHRANYLGYMKKIDLGNKGSILKYHFTFHGVDKPVGSMFIGTSPELELALYSTCFIIRADRICPLKMNGNKFIIRTFTYRYRGKNMIGSAFPEI